MLQTPMEIKICISIRSDHSHFPWLLSIWIWLHQVIYFRQSLNQQGVAIVMKSRHLSREFIISCYFLFSFLLRLSPWAAFLLLFVQSSLRLRDLFEVFGAHVCPNQLSLLTHGFYLAPSGIENDEGVSESQAESYKYDDFLLLVDQHFLPSKMGDIVPDTFAFELLDIEHFHGILISSPSPFYQNTVQRS